MRSRYQTRRAGPLPEWFNFFDPRKSQSILDEAYSKSEARQKAREIPGSINPDNPEQYWSGSEWLNLSDIPDSTTQKVSIPNTLKQQGTLEERLRKIKPSIMDPDGSVREAVSYTHLTLPTTPYV